MNLSDSSSSWIFFEVCSWFSHWRCTSPAAPADHGSWRRGSMVKKKRCAHCNRVFRPDPRVKEQSYCWRKSCQQARKTRWQKHKMKTDPDYQANQKNAWRSWQQRNRNYWRPYREKRPEYRERNRLLQAKRDEARRKRNLAKMDALRATSSIETGTYYLVPSHLSHLAKMDALGQEFLIISTGCKDSRQVLQKRTRLPAGARSP
jgi:hypothetical protein